MFFVIIGGFPMPIVQTFTIKSNHTHSFTYDASGNVLTATCVRALYS